MLLLVRLIHIVIGVFWAGTIIFNAWLLAPTLRDLGPEGGKVMGGLAKRGMLTILPVSGILTILSGIWLYWHASVGFSEISGVGYAVRSFAGFLSRPFALRRAASVRRAAIITLPSGTM